VALRGDLTAPDDLLYLAAHVRVGDVQKFQRLSADAFPTEQQVFGTNVVVPEQPGFLVSEVDGSPGLAGEPAHETRGLPSRRCHPEPVGQRISSSHRRLPHNRRPLAAWPQPRRQPVSDTAGVARAVREFHNDGSQWPWGIRFDLPAVGCQELQHGGQRDLVVAVSEWSLAHERIQQDRGLDGRPTGLAARPRLLKCGLGGH
jgi:hypothetical protein